MSSESEVLSQDIDYIFENIVGGNSYWQWYTVLTLWPIAMASGFPWLLHLFTSYEPRVLIILGCLLSENQISIFHGF